jgi:hypothetical protein
MKPPTFATTGIGSLPHTNLELALQQALQLDIPYLPQLPVRDPAEFMVPQALAGFPGLCFDADGTTTIDAQVWEREAVPLERRLEVALEGGDPLSFAPPSEGWAAWQPFLWEVEARRLPYAKAQIAGPLTVRWAVKLTDGRRLCEIPSLERAAYRLILARSIAMVRAIRDRGATPIFFFDEAGLYALGSRDPRDLLALQELRIALLALEREGALTGLHSCGNTAWGQVLGLRMSYLSFDVRLSLEAILRSRAELSGFLSAGGRLALGIVPTDGGAAYDLEEIIAMTRTGLAGLPLDGTLLSPACGLALRSIPACEAVFEDLQRAQQALRS